MGSNVCARCAGVGETCCRLLKGQEDLCFPLSVLERERIHDYSPHLGAFAMSPNSSAFLDHMTRLFPSEPRLIEELFPERKLHFRLAMSLDGACKLLGPSGCILPIQVRPYYCRLFPIWMSGGEPMMVMTDICRAVREARSPLGLIESVGLSVAKVRDLHSKLRLAWGLPPREGMPQVPKAFARYTR